MDSKKILIGTIVFAVIFLALPYYSAYQSRKRLLRLEEQLRKKARRRRAEYEMEQDEQSSVKM